MSPPVNSFYSFRAPTQIYLTTWVVTSTFSLTQPTDIFNLLEQRMPNKATSLPSLILKWPQNMHLLAFINSLLYKLQV